MLAFVPMAQEPDIWPVVMEAIKAGRQVALLRHAHDGDNYVPCMVRDLERDLRPGQFGILQHHLIHLGQRLGHLARLFVEIGEEIGVHGVFLRLIGISNVAGAFSTLTMTKSLPC